MSENKLSKVDNSCKIENVANEYFVRPATDVLEDGDTLVLLADVPGLDEKSLEINLEGNLLTIKGKAPAGSGQALSREFCVSGYNRQFRISEDYDVASAAAELKDGVLTLRIPKAEAAKPKRIAVTVH